jgi:hypothetical protein
MYLLSGEDAVGLPLPESCCSRLRLAKFLHKTAKIYGKNEEESSNEFGQGNE